MQERLLSLCLWPALSWHFLAQSWLLGWAPAQSPLRGLRVLGLYVQAGPSRDWSKPARHWKLHCGQLRRALALRRERGELYAGRGGEGEAAEALKGAAACSVGGCGGLGMSRVAYIDPWELPLSGLGQSFVPEPLNSSVRDGWYLLLLEVIKTKGRGIQCWESARSVVACRPCGPSH